MTDQYVDQKIQEALSATENNKADAHKLLLTWAVRDQQLLLGLAKPHLKALAMDRIADFVKKNKKSAAGKSSLTVHDILDHTKGEKRGSKTLVPPPKSSKNQETMMRKLAAAFKKK